MAPNKIMRFVTRLSTMLEGSVGNAKKPNVAFMTRFLVSIGNLGSSETRVVHALKARLCV
uniref:Uncharacterized protein n=1 Tax=Arundo donax TaxID=35708 RepID=A0A0A9F1W7_ARUDO